MLHYNAEVRLAIGYAHIKKGSFTLSSQSSIVSEDGLNFSIKSVQSERSDRLIDVMFSCRNEEEKQSWMEMLNEVATQYQVLCVSD